MPQTPIDPNRIYREHEAIDIFGFSRSRLYDKIKSGDVPKPVLLSKPPSRARGWYGWMILDHRAKLEAQQAEWEAAPTTDKKVEEGVTPTLRYVPKGGNIRPSPTRPVEKRKDLKRPERLPKRSAK